MSKIITLKCEMCGEYFRGMPWFIYCVPCAAEMKTGKRPKPVPLPPKPEPKAAEPPKLEPPKPVEQKPVEQKAEQKTEQPKVEQPKPSKPKRPKKEKPMTKFEETLSRCDPFRYGDAQKKKSIEQFARIDLSQYASLINGRKA